MIPYKGIVSVEKTIKYVLENTDYNYKHDLNSFDFSLLKLRLNETELSEIILQYIKYNIEPQYFSTIYQLCESLQVSSINKDNYSLLNEYIDVLLKNYKTFPERVYLSKLLNSFNDKKIPLDFLRYTYANIAFKKLHSDDENILKYFIDYVINARQYYVDDRALFSSVISLIDNIDTSHLIMGNLEKIKEAIKIQLIEDKKANGIYEIDQFMLEELDRKINEVSEIETKIETLIQITNQQIKLLNEEKTKANEDITNAKISSLNALKQEANLVINRFNAAYLELLNNKRSSLLEEKNLLISDMSLEFEKEKQELQTLVASLGQRVSIEIGRIKKQSDTSLEKINNIISNNGEVKKIFEIAKQDESFVKNLAQVIPVTLEQKSNPVEIGQSVVVPNIIIPNQEKEVNYKVNRYFDKNIPFNKRFNELMERKKIDIMENGAIYHEKFDDLLTLILNDDAPYMYGPSGCGKTYMIEKQLSHLLGIDVVTNGYIMYETDILGFNNANGMYTPSNFYRCYKYGDIIFLDELDNSMASSTIVLNSFLGKKDDSSYTFPNGDKVKKHPNFRILSAGNTRGTGRTVAYNTRQKLDETLMQRLTPIEIDYDSRIEKKILQDYPGWYNFAINYREALKEIVLNGTDGPNYNGTITTRDIETIKGYKDNDCFSDEKIIEYKVIENKNIDYLNQIIQNMENIASENKKAFTKEGTILYEKFKKLSKMRKY